MAVCVPFMFPLFLYAVLNSNVVTLRQGGIRWRETFYPLETLRAGKTCVKEPERRRQNRWKGLQPITGLAHKVDGLSKIIV